MEENDERHADDMAALSLPSRLVLAVAVALALVAVVVHVAMVFLHVAPENTVTQRHGGVVDSYVYPEFEQNWKLFAPDPLRHNIVVQARAELRTVDGGRRVTDWTDLTARDIDAIRHNPLPSHTQQNQLRRAWDVYVRFHDDQERPRGMRGKLSQRYVCRLAMDRLNAGHDGESVRWVQVRSLAEPVPAPRWSDEEGAPATGYRTLPWCPAADADLPKGAHR